MHGIRQPDNDIPNDGTHKARHTPCVLNEEVDVVLKTKGRDRGGQVMMHNPGHHTLPMLDDNQGSRTHGWMAGTADGGEPGNHIMPTLDGEHRTHTQVSGRLWAKLVDVGRQGAPLGLSRDPGAFAGTRGSRHDILPRKTTLKTLPGASREN